MQATLQSYEGEVSDFLVESKWKDVGAADLVVAHNAREKPAPVAFSIITSATDEIVCIAQRYTQLSQTSTIRTLLATSEPPKRIRTSRSRMRGDESRHRRR